MSVNQKTSADGSYTVPTRRTSGPASAEEYCCRPVLEIQCNWRLGRRSAVSLMAAHTIELNTAAGLEASPSLGLSPAPLNMNHYANKKSAAESMLDVALLMANASQLKAVLEQGPESSLYTSLITLISLSLCLQVLVGILLIFIVKWNLNDEQKHLRLNVLENITTGCVFIIVVINVFITAFGVQRPNPGVRQ